MRVSQEAIAQAAVSGSNASAKAINNFVSQLARQADQAGKTRAEILQMKAAQMGIADSVSGYIGKIDEATKHTHGFNMATTGARRELLVLAHEASQGNWSKFGGSLMVLGERTDALSAVFSAAGLTAGVFLAALAGVAMAAIKGAEEAKQLNAALVLTSNYAGLTAQSFADMQEAVSGKSGGSLGKAGEVLRELAASGQYTSSEMEGLANVIVRTAEISGKKLEEVAKEYDKLAEDPAKWAYAHNQSMNFMDTATYQHIEALQKAGDKHGAVQAVIEAATAQVQSSSEKHLSAASQAWHNLTKEVDTFWTKLKQGMSTGASLQDKIDTLQAEREAISSSPLSAGRIGEINKQIAALGAQQKAINDAADAQKKAAELHKAGVEAEKRVETMRDQILTNAQKRQKDLEQLNRDRAAVLADGGKFSEADYQKIVDGINAKYKDPKPKSNNGSISASMAQIGVDNAALEDQRKSALAQSKADYETGRRSYEDYYANVRDINVKFLSEEIDNAKKREDIAAGKKEASARIQAHKDWQKLVDERLKAEQDYTNAIAEFEKKRAVDVQRYRDQQANVLQKNADAYSHADDTRYMSKSDAADYGARLRVREAYYQQVEALKLKYGDDPRADQVTYQKKLTIAAQAFADQQSQLEAHLAQEKEKRASYTDQMHLAITQLGGDGQTNAQLVATAFTSSWQTASSALDTFITTGKGNFQQFTASILADLAKIALHAAEMQIFQSIGMAAFSTGGPVGHFADGGAIVGAGTGTSDSIPAMLSNGEYVIRASQAKKYHSLLESINKGHTSHFASGGAVGAVSSSAPASGGGNPVSVVVHNNGGGGLTDQDAKDLHTLVSAFVDKRMGQAMRGQGGYAYQMRYNQI